VDDRELLVAAGTLRQGANRLSRRMRLERGEARVTQQQVSVLAHLTLDGPGTPGDLAEAERVQPQSLTRTLSSLEGAGLITRRPHPLDRRSTLLDITDEGRRVLRQDVRGRDVWLASVMGAELTAAERGLLRLAGELMTRLAATPGSGRVTRPR
jgi:DNA-binding MarR family transcriptional regulator